MTDEQRPLGQRFSQIYLDLGQSSTDSVRLRNRAGEYFYATFFAHGLPVRKAVLSEIGASMPITGVPAHDVREFLKQSGLHDFLDGLTVVARTLPEYGQSGRDFPRSTWIGFINRALKETNVSFELDAKGGVHPRIDASFVANRQSALRGLEATRYQAAREHFDEAYSALDGPEARTGHAIREMHLALETVFKQHFQSASRLDVGEITKLLKPRVVARLKGPELEAAKLMLTSAGSFISAGHQFRHANGEPEPAPPSMDVTVWMLSQGTAFLRWLVAFVEADAD